MADDQRDIDVLFQKAGGFGIFQILLSISEQWLALHLCCTATVIYALGTIPPDLFCVDPDPRWNGTEHELCDVVSNCTNYTSTIEFHSFAEEFGLYCDKEYVHRMMASITAGIALAWGPILGHIIDHVGRKWVFLIGYFFAIVFTFLASFATSWQMLMGAFIAMSFSEYSVSYTFFSELVTKRYRSVIAVCTQWCVAYCSNALIGYLTGNWRAYLQAVAVICTPLGLFYAILLVESPRWLLQKERFGAASKSFNWIGRINRASDENLDSLSTQKLELYAPHEKPGVPYNLFHLFSTKQLAICSVLQAAHVMVNVLGAMIILYDIHKLEGSAFLNVALHGLLRVWAPFLVVWLDWRVPKFGRKSLLLTSLSIVTLAYIGNSVIFMTGKQKQHTMKILMTVFSQIAALVVVSLFIISVQLFTVELFPTVLRNIANSFIGFFGGIAAIIAPQALYLGNYWPPLPYVLVTIICVAVFTADIFLLPETHGKPLLENLDDVKRTKFELRRPTPKVRPDTYA